MKVSPHNFSKSPVKEVICRYNSAGQVIELYIPKPYPGWLVIQDKLAVSLDMYHSDNFHDLMLQYTDEFELFSDDEPDKLISIVHEIPKILVSRMIMGPKTEIFVRGNEQGTKILIRYIREKEKITLEFQANSQIDKGYTRDMAARWFERAREDIHLLFDVIVSEKLRKRL